jgi:hypothetical protein
VAIELPGFRPLLADPDAGGAAAQAPAVSSSA